MLMDSNEPFHTVKPERFRHRKILIPRRQIDALIAPGWQRQGLHCAQPGLGGLLTQYTQTLIEEMDALSAAEAGVALDNLCRLLALYADAHAKHAGPAERAVHAARLVQVRRYIDQHLADPALNSRHRWRRRTGCRCAACTCCSSRPG